MGSSASKAAKRVYPSAGAIARDNAVTFTPPPSTFPTPAARSSPIDPPPSTTSSSSTPGQLASESRPNELARLGGGDPLFLSKLRELGQVTIQDGKSSFQGPQSSEPNAAQDLLHQRTLDPISFPTGSPTDPQPTEADAHNRLDAASLVALLEARRSARSPEDARRVAEQWNVDLALVDRLAAFVNPPTVGPEAVVEDEKGERRFAAIWQDPLVSPARVRDHKQIA